MALDLLKLLHSQVRKLGPPQSSPEKQRKNRSVPFAFDSGIVRGSDNLFDFGLAKPLPSGFSDLLGSFEAAGNDNLFFPW